jgi:bifunctional oligoribonuclease and PAP phosphatase NrnA
MNTLPPFQLLLSRCRQAESILVTGPIFPDGDSIGACLALARSLQELTGARIDVAGNSSFRYAWLPRIGDMIPDSSISGSYDIAIVMDGDRHRLPDKVREAYFSAKEKMIIDHHASTDSRGYDLAIIDTHSASTCEIVFQIIEQWGLQLDREFAELIYTGVIFDTGGFRHSNTKPQTHILAARLLETGIDHSGISSRILMERQSSGIRLLGHALGKMEYLMDGRICFCWITWKELQRLGCQLGDYEGIVETMLFIKGVMLSCVCIEREPGALKLSLRSRCGINVADLAQKISANGGGHPRAAGVMLPGTETETRGHIVGLLEAAL